MADLQEIVTAFGHLLRVSGVPVTPERSARFAECVVLAEPQSLAELGWLGRVTLLSSHDQIEVFDRLFAQVFGGVVDLADFRGDSDKPTPPAVLPAGDRTEGDPERDQVGESRPSGVSGTAGEAGADEEDDDEEKSILAAVSTEERLGTKNFSHCTAEELALIYALVERLPLVPPLRRARRRRRHHAGQRLDVRATLRAAHRTSGDPVRRIHRRRTQRPRRVVLIADVSGSMEPYARVYLHLMLGAVRALRAEAFVFATRLTRLTRALSAAQPDVAYRKAAEAAPDWSGGTRIGSALKVFLDDYGRRGLARGAVVVIVSDGWEIEDPELVGRSMEQLSRLAFHVVWVNPRRASPEYQPLVGGMAAALPYVGTFVSGHSLDSLEEVMAAIQRTAYDARDLAPPDLRPAAGRRRPSLSSRGQGSPAG